ncbi:MAG: DUF1289 domain-containing protein [Pseudomonadota bacterium]
MTIVGELLSPCVRICTLDDNNICLGCGRTLDEITSWSRLSTAERQRIMARLAEADPAPWLASADGSA